LGFSLVTKSLILEDFKVFSGSTSSVFCEKRNIRRREEITMEDPITNPRICGSLSNFSFFRVIVLIF